MLPWSRQNRGGSDGNWGTRPAWCIIVAKFCTMLCKLMSMWVTRISGLLTCIRSWSQSLAPRVGGGWEVLGVLDLEEDLGLTILYKWYSNQHKHNSGTQSCTNTPTAQWLQSRSTGDPNLVKYRNNAVQKCNGSVTRAFQFNKQTQKLLNQRHFNGHDTETNKAELKWYQ